MWPKMPYVPPYTTIAPGMGCALTWKPAAAAAAYRSMALPNRARGWFQRGSPGCISAQVASAPATHWLVTPDGLMCAARSAGHCGVAIRWTQPGVGMGWTAGRLPPPIDGP